ncbi:MAG: hypothetical protein IT372_42595 [Polyangiaceae bacterium]|nr:hypothetical protein [Polyangiaceae bacterium]
MTFERARLEELARVPWIDGSNGRGLLGALGAAQDSELRTLKDGVLARCPAAGPDDALAYQGRDRTILRAPIEDAGAYRARLVEANALWYWCGAGDAYVNIFTPYLLSAGTVSVLSNHEIVWDDNADWSSRVFLLLDSRDGSFGTDSVWDADASVWQDDPDDGATFTWDSSATVADLHYLRRSIRNFKADWAYPVTIAVWLSGGQLEDGYWDSVGAVYDDGGVWSEDGGEPLYWTLGHVWGEEQWVGDGVDTWLEDGDEPTSPIPETEQWVDFVD